MSKLLGASLAALAVLIAPSADAQERRAFSPADLLSLERAFDIQLSPDERRVSFTIATPETATNNIPSRIWILDVASRQSRRIGGDVDSSSARWSPDGRGLYYLSGKSGLSQIWFAPVDGGEPRQVSDLPLDIETIKVSPDGKRLLATMEIYPDCPDLQCSAARLKQSSESVVKAKIYDRLFIRHWNRWKDGRQSHLFSLEVGADGRVGSKVVDLSRELDADVPSRPRGDDQDYAFSPDGKRVAFMARIKGKNEAWSTNFDIFEVDVEGRERPVNLTSSNPAWDAEPKFSPDGRWLAWKAMDRPSNEADRFHLVLKDRATGKVHTVAGDWDRSIYHYDFSKDSKRVFAATDHLGEHPLWSVDLATGKPTLLRDGGTVTEFSVGKKSIVYGLASIGAPVDLYRMGLKGGSERLTNINADRLASVDLGEFEQFSFSGWNGEKVYGYVVKPVGYTPGRKYPVAFVVHGGPQLSYGNGWSYRWNPQVYAGAGIGVVFIDFHGSTGYGQRFTDSITGDWGGKPLEDLKLGLAAAIERFPWLDGDRVCALGSSYSGFMMNWIQGNWSDRFRCIVNQSGVFSVRAMYYETDEMWLDEFEFGGTQFANPAGYEKFDPLDHVAKWQTPMLVAHGEMDFNVPYSQGVSAFTALQRRGIESRLIIYPDEGHFFSKPGNALTWQGEVLAWLNRWLAPEKGAQQLSGKE